VIGRRPPSKAEMHHLEEAVREEAYNFGMVRTLSDGREERSARGACRAARGQASTGSATQAPESDLKRSGNLRHCAGKHIVGQ
jgi:hypothetical protein